MSKSSAPGRSDECADEPKVGRASVLKLFRICQGEKGLPISGRYFGRRTPLGEPERQAFLLPAVKGDSL